MKRATVPVQKSVVLTEGGTVASNVNVNIPRNAAAVVAYNVAVSAGNSYVIATLALLPGGGDQHDLCTFANVRGPKSAVGLFPIDASVDTLTSGVNLSGIVATAGGGAAQTVTFNAYVTFLINENTADQTPFAEAIPFTATPTAEAANLGVWTSLAATAQTIDFFAVGQFDQLDILAAWFIAGAVVAPSINYWDGTTAVPLETFAAAASGVFNMANITTAAGGVGYAGNPVSIADPTSGTRAVRFSVPSAGGAFTTTLYVLYRSRPQR